MKFEDLKLGMMVLVPWHKGLPYLVYRENDVVDQERKPLVAKVVDIEHKGNLGIMLMVPKHTPFSWNISYGSSKYYKLRSQDRIKSILLQHKFWWTHVVHLSLAHCTEVGEL